MQNALWIASIFGPLLAIIGLWMLLYGENLMKVITSVKNTPGVFYVNGIMNLIIGLAVLSQYNLWTWNPAILVTILGWVMILRGVFVLYAPQLVIQCTMTHPSVIKVMGIIPFIWGLALCWLAFLM
jgi:hypothetical protein